ncbi:MAG: hypothetical protein J5851_02510 [Oscillospiraceae bacterium]|nr:hypothetical protein [Oscillospiraceae bacterium]
MLHILASIGIGIGGFLVSLLICAAIGKEKITEVLDIGDAYAVSDVKRSDPTLMYGVAVPVTAIMFGIMLHVLTDFSLLKIVGLSLLALVGIFMIGLLIGAIVGLIKKADNNSNVGFKEATIVCCAATGVMLAITIANMGLF